MLRENHFSQKILFWGKMNFENYFYFEASLAVNLFSQLQLIVWQKNSNPQIQYNLNLILRGYNIELTYSSDFPD